MMLDMRRSQSVLLILFAQFFLIYGNDFVTTCTSTKNHMKVAYPRRCRFFQGTLEFPEDEKDEDLKNIYGVFGNVVVNGSSLKFLENIRFIYTGPTHRKAFSIYAKDLKDSSKLKHLESIKHVDQAFIGPFEDFPHEMAEHSMLIKAGVPTNYMLREWNPKTKRQLYSLRVKIAIGGLVVQAVIFIMLFMCLIAKKAMCCAGKRDKQAGKSNLSSEPISVQSGSHEPIEGQSKSHEPIEPQSPMKPEAVGSNTNTATTT